MALVKAQNLLSSAKNLRSSAKTCPGRARARTAAPLAIGVGQLIQAELLAAGRPSWAISAAIRARTRSRGYLMALAAGATRVGLDGKQAGAVTDAERQHAVEQLDDRFPWWRKRT
jgi:sRNA-binding protein